MRLLAFFALALCACATSSTEVKDDAPKPEAALDSPTLLSRASAVMSRDKCDAERMKIPGVTGAAGLCFDDIVMFGVFTSCAEGKEAFCSVEGLAKMAAEDDSAVIVADELQLPSGETLALHRAEGDEGETVFVVDKGLPEGVELMVCGFRQPIFAGRCSEIFDELLTGASRPASGVLALRGELEEDCEVEDHWGWRADCEDGEVFVAAIKAPDSVPGPTVDGLIKTLQGSEADVAVEAKRIDLATHKGAKVYVVDAVEKEKPIRVYVVEEGLTPEIKMFACAWRDDKGHDPICLSLLDRVLR